MEYECLKGVTKEDVEGMSHEELEALIEKVNKETWDAAVRAKIIELLAGNTKLNVRPIIGAN